MLHLRFINCKSKLINAIKRNKSSLAFRSDTLIGHLAKSSVLCTEGESLVHAVVSCNRKQTEFKDALPLSVEYRARAYAFGAIPNIHSRRDRHGSDEEILVARFIDRAVRPLFPKGCLTEI